MGKPVNRPIQIMTRVNQEEKDIIMQKMSMLGMSNQSQYLRRMAIYGHMIEIDMGPLNDVSVELSRIGNNLNQLTRATHQKKDIYKEDILAIRQELEIVMKKFGGYLDKLIAVE